ncbi:MAG: 30S ribosomal protein S17 [Desulfurococcales archaeon]|nr:30S ribosomal protein S17 [Desulfurococcales archaeon]
MPAPRALKKLSIPGVEPPKRTCDDPNCPWHGHLRVRGVLLEGIVEKLRAKGTAVVRHDYIYYVKKYKRYEKRSKRIKAHVPPCIDVKEGDLVVIGETRPLAKTVKFVVLGVKKRAGG